MYKNVELIQKELHKDLKIAPLENMSFASNVSHLAITISEFFHACKSQPIVFVKNDNSILPVVITGLKQDENLFLDKKKNWIDTEYCPLFLRQYPFVYIKTGDVMSLAYDKDCKAVNTKKGEPIFDDADNISELTKKVLFTLEQYQKNMEATHTLCNILNQLELFVPFTPEVRIGNDGYKFDGLYAVDEAKFHSLNDERKLELDKLGFYTLIVAHLISLSNFHKLIALSQKTK